ncbi:hypothetical protein KEM55_002146 [Ascosphaera atra]|nr:hypothetical protein KEM55_002146 [Ascosphaera atra]
MDKGASLEDILAKGGQTLVKGQLSGDLEWWEDGSIRALSDAPLAEPEQTSQSKEETPSGSNEKN